MATNLQKVKDHPSNLLIDWRWKVELRDDIKNGIERSARYLRTYEDEHRVIFAALDVDALLEVRARYAADDDEALRDAVRDLLGLDD